jgi:hypothetical protein
MIQHFMDERTGPPVEAAKNGLCTTFQETFSEDQNALKPGQKISDQKLWHDVRLSYSIVVQYVNNSLNRALTLWYLLLGLMSKLGAASVFAASSRTDCVAPKRRFKNTLLTMPHF